MRNFSATTAKNQSGRLLDAAAEAPVAITRRGRVVADVAAPKDFATPAQSLEERLAECLRAAGVRYATLFGSLARGAAQGAFRVTPQIDSQAIEVRLRELSRRLKCVAGSKMASALLSPS